MRSDRLQRCSGVFPRGMPALCTSQQPALRPYTTLPAVWMDAYDSNTALPWDWIPVPARTLAFIPSATGLTRSPRRPHPSPAQAPKRRVAAAPAAAKKAAAPAKAVNPLFEKRSRTYGAPLLGTNAREGPLRIWGRDGHGLSS